VAVGDVGIGVIGVPSERRMTWARAGFVAGVVLLLAVSWWPFRLDVPRPLESGVETRSDGSLGFVDEAFASTTGPPSWLATALDQRHLEVALRVQSADPGQTGPARIFALSAPPRGASRDVLEHDLVIGQDGPDLIVRVVRPGPDGQGTPPLIAAGVFAQRTWREVELVLGDEVTLTVDGRVRAREAPTIGWAGRWDGRHELSLGNTLSGQRPWAGTIARATVVAGDETVDVLASPELEIQERARRLPARLTGEVSRPPAQRVLVGGLHVLLGAFLGAALVIGWPDRPLRSHLGALVGIAVVANVGKVFVAGRHPSVATALLQTGGAGLGAAALYEVVRTRWRRAG
jgi:hypothetical protein